MRNQITCQCNAYHFPHRICGGKCTGTGWCESHRELEPDLCDACNCFDNGECQVSTGQEDFRSGDCYEQELRSHYLKEQYGNLPVDLEQIAERQYQSFFNDHVVVIHVGS